MKRLLCIAASLTAFSAFAADHHVYKGTEKVSNTTEKDITIAITEVEHAVKPVVVPVVKKVKPPVARVSEENWNNAVYGMAIEVSNSLPQVEIKGKRVTPEIQAYFCTPALFPSQPTAERCITLAGEIQSGETAYYLLTVEQLDKIFKKGAGKGSFEFSDKYQTTSKSWGCEQPDYQVTLDSNFDAKQVWQVNVTARNTMSYTCGIVQR